MKKNLQKYIKYIYVKQFLCVLFRIESNRIETNQMIIVGWFSCCFCCASRDDHGGAGRRRRQRRADHAEPAEGAERALQAAHGRGSRSFTVHSLPPFTFLLLILEELERG